MALKLVDMICNKAITLVVQDEHGQEQVFMRVWYTDEDNPGVENVMWLQGNPYGYDYRKLTQEEGERISAAVFPQALAYVEGQSAIDSEALLEQVLHVECSTEEEAIRMMKKIEEMLKGQMQ